MKINVPFYRQTNNYNCGPATLKMAAEYFGKKISFKNIGKSCLSKKGRGHSPIHLIIGAMNESMNATLYSNYIDNKNILVKEAKKLGILFKKNNLGTKKILSMIDRGYIPIVLLDWNFARGKEGQMYHFMPLVGYNKNFVYLHDPNFKEGKPFVKIKIESFEESRKEGKVTRDIIVIKGLTKI